MCATSSDRLARCASQRGFTIAELVAVMVIVGVLAAVALPKFSAGLAVRDDVFRDEVVSALRYAHATATSHRRLVCATVDSTSVSLAIAAVNPATACSASLPGPDGSATYASTNSGTTASAAPSGTLYFQPSGRVTSDAAGATTTDTTITISGVSSAISVVGETGHVE